MQKKNLAGARIEATEYRKQTNTNRNRTRGNSFYESSFFFLSKGSEIPTALYAELSSGYSSQLQGIGRVCERWVVSFQVPGSCIQCTSGGH